MPGGAIEPSACLKTMKNGAPPPGKLRSIDKRIVRCVDLARPGVTLRAHGTEAGPPGVLVHPPTTGVNGKPVRLVKMPLILQPPNAFAAKLSLPVKNGRSYMPWSVKKCFTS